MSADSLEDKALELIKSRPNGVLQSELWKDLNIDSRKCSRVIARLEEEGKIKRTWETVKGTRTYRISYLPQKSEEPKKEVNFELILADERVAPCIGCTYECEPDYCPDLGNWIELLAKSPAKGSPGAVVNPMPEGATSSAGITGGIASTPAQAARNTVKGVVKGAKSTKELKEKEAEEIKKAKEAKPEKVTKEVKKVKAAPVKEAPKESKKEPKKEAKKEPVKESKAAKTTMGLKKGKK